MHVWGARGESSGNTFKALFFFILNEKRNGKERKHIYIKHIVYMLLYSFTFCFAFVDDITNGAGGRSTGCRVYGRGRFFFEYMYI